MQKLLLLLALPVLAIFAAPPSSCIFGKVTDESGEELIGASIIISSADTIFKLITDINGDYRCCPPPGTYKITATYTGFEKLEIPKIGLGSNDRKMDLMMHSQSTLSEVEVTEFKVDLVKADQTSGGKALTSEQIKNLPTRSLESISATTSGTSSVDGGPVNVKGSRSTATNYYVDGVRVSGASVPGQQMDKRRVEAKPAPVLQMNTGRDDHDTPPESGTEQYNTIRENTFQPARETPVSTFSIDVDKASYANVRRYIQSGQKPPADAVRIEEMINYFDYDYPKPAGKDPIRIVTELGKCPWNTEHHILMVGLQGQAIDQQQVPPSNLVFLVDVSGSMSSENKLPLVKQSLYLLLDQLRPTDRVALVTYAGNTAVVLGSTAVSEKKTIKAAIDQLGAGGGTAGASGIQLAYQTARTNFKDKGNNRVILCTDGDFNIGQSSEQDLVNIIETERKSGVYLTVLGFGTGNYQDGKMQELADRGNGNHAYIDQISEARKVLVQEFAGTLYTIAKDVKLQLEFNPDQVESYRLIGYENRMLAKEDFDNDAKDAGELGIGHTVTALYEIVPNQQSRQSNGELVHLKFRYKAPEGNGPSKLIEQSVPAVCAAKASDNFLLSTAVAEFGLLLRNSTYKGTASWEHAAAQSATGADPQGYKAELAKLIAEVKK